MRTRLLVVFALLVLAGCAALPINAVPPKVSVAEIDIKSLGLFEQHFDVRLRLTNPNDFDLGIEALDFELELNGRPFAKGLARSPVLIPAVSSVVLRVDAITQSKNLVQQIRTLPPETLREGVPYRIKGRIRTDQSSAWLPFEQRGVYGGGETPARGIAI